MKNWLFVFFLLPGISYADTDIFTSINMKNISAQNQPIVKTAVKRIIAACPKFETYWGDVKSVEVKVKKEIKKVAGAKEKTVKDYRRDSFGWKNYLALIIQIKEKTEFIPAKDKISGHTLTYYAGGGNRAGILTQKPQAKKFCGGFIYSEFTRNAFMEDTKMMSLEKLQ